MNFPIIEGSIHYLEANRWEDNPKNFSYAGGYKAYLLVKNRHTKVWEFPTTEVLG